MSSPRQASIRAALQAAVKTAMKARDRDALSVYRTALAAIDNAEAVPIDAGQRAGAIEASPVGVGTQDAVRRELTEQEIADIVRREAADRRATAASLDGAAPERAARLRDEAGLLERITSVG